MRCSFSLSHRVGMLILGVAWPGCCLCATSMERSICALFRGWAKFSVRAYYFVNSFLFFFLPPSSSSATPSLSLSPNAARDLVLSGEDRQAGERRAAAPIFSRNLCRMSLPFGRCGRRRTEASLIILNGTHVCVALIISLFHCSRVFAL